MSEIITPAGRALLLKIWMPYHIGEEFLIALICLAIAARAFRVARETDAVRDIEVRGRVFLVSSGFFLLGINSALHGFIHYAGYNQNLLYHTLVGYCLGLLTLVAAFFSDRPWRLRAFPLLYIPLLILLYPGVYEKIPIFAKFRPFVWIFISYLSGMVSILYLSAFYHTRLNRYLLSALGHIMICVSAILLFFPTGIGSAAWTYGHILRPMGFGVLFFSMNRDELLHMRASVLYKLLIVFSFLAAIPLLVFGMVLFYETIYPIQVEGKRMIVFLLVMVTLASALVFGLGMVIRLIRPILRLKDDVTRIGEEGLSGEIETKGSDEIGKLSEAFNDMLLKLRDSFAERDRLSRLAATGELAATLAHEIKNPLNAIGGAADYLKENFDGSLIQEFTGVISEETSRINKLTSNLLNFAKPSQPVFKPEDINGLVDETVSLLKQEWDEQGVSVEKSLDVNVPTVNFDYNQMKQVLINLLLNAMQAIGENGSVTIATGTSDGSIYMSVRDNGTGIAEEDMENIFNPFFTTKTRGTGLGLALSKKTTKEHGGDINVQSTPGEGSTFTVLLPARRGEKE